MAKTKSRPRARRGGKPVKVAAKKPKKRAVTSGRAGAKKAATGRKSTAAKKVAKAAPTGGKGGARAKAISASGSMQKTKAKVKSASASRVARGPVKAKMRKSSAAKVGSSELAAEHFADKNDFGTPAREARAGGRGPTAAEGLRRNEEGRAGALGDRTHGVGSALSDSGSGSGGDLDTDFIGLGPNGGIAQEPPTGDVSGPDATTGTGDEFASGGHAEGLNQLPPGTHAAASTQVFDTVDHSGEDLSTRDGFPRPEIEDMQENSD